MTPVLNSWVLGAYTAMLGRLSAATAALKATEDRNIASESDSESEHSSYTEKYVGCSFNKRRSFDSITIHSGSKGKKHAKSN